MLTEEESKLYDRSIRLWGVQVQQRIRNATVLLVGLKGCNVEIAKNLVLAGLKRVALFDDEPVNVKTDSAVNFLAHDTLYGNADNDVSGTTTGRAEACVAALQELNPFVQVDVVHSLPSVNGDNGARATGSDSSPPFAMVCASEQSSARIAELNEQCRQLGAKFVAVRSLGPDGGVAMFDFGPVYSYRPQNSDAGADEPGQEQLFDPVTQALWPTASCPGPTTGRRALAAWTKFCQLSAAERNQSPGSVDASNHQAAVCAIVGGVVAQEIVKVFSAVDEAMNNVFVFDPVAGGKVFQIK